MKGKRKVVSWVMVAILCMPYLALSGEPAIAYAQEESSEILTSGDWAYSDNGDYVYIEGYTGTETEITIPDEIEGKPVKKINPGAFQDKTTITSVSIPSGVESIEEAAFSECTALQEITIPDTVTIIGKSAFGNCDGLTDSDLLPDSIFSIQDSAFQGCDGLTAIRIPDSVVTIGESAFADCSKLGTVTFSANLKSVGAEAFSGCTVLDNVEIPVGTEVIGSKAFYDCSGLTWIFMPKSVADIGEEALAECNESLTICMGWGSSSEAVSEYAQENNITITHQQDVEQDYLVEDKWRYQIQSDNTVKILKYLSIAENAIAEVPATLPDEGGNNEYPVTEIGAYAFLGKDNLQAAVIPDSVTKIGTGAFNSCGDCMVWIPKYVTDIGSSAFSGCSGMTAYTEEEAEYVIDYINRKKISYVISDAGRDYEVLKSSDEDDGVVTNNIEAYVGNDTEVEIPAIIQCWPVTYVLGFKGNTKVESVSIPDSVNQIGDFAFQNCTNLKKITMTDSVLYINRSAFQGCTSLTDIILSKNLEEMQYNAFRGCTSLKSIEIPGKLPNLQDYLFRGCTALERIVIPATVTYISGTAFTDVGEQLTIYTTSNSKAHMYALMNSIQYVLEDSVQAGGITLSQTSISMKVGETCSLTATVEQPEAASVTVGWSSSDSSVASVNEEGMITACKAGTANITASYTDEENGVISVSCKVTVTAAEDEEENEPGSGGSGNNNDPSQGNVNPPTDNGTSTGGGTSTDGGASTTQEPAKKIKVPSVSKVSKFKASAKKKALTLSWKKVKNASGYQVQVSTKKNFKGAKTISVKKTKVSYTASKLKSKKKYYVRIRAYINYKDASKKTKKAYGKWVETSKRTK